MALQSSGAISLGDLQTEYGGENPISIDEYYRNGTYVPSIKVVEQNRTPATGDYYTLNDTWVYWNTGSNDAWYMFWSGALVASGTSSTLPVYADVGGYRYYTGNLRQAGVEGYQNWYGIYRTEYSEQDINVNVPTSGEVSINDFYDGEQI